MKKDFASISIFLFVWTTNAQAAVVWQDDFDGYTSNWSCTDAECEDGCPPGYYGCRGDQSVVGGPDIEIHTDYERSNPGGNNRGYRVWIYDGTSGTCCENVLRKSGSFGTDFYLRWYMRLSTENMGNYWKMFRMFSNGTQRFILELKYRFAWGETRFIVSDGVAEAPWTQWTVSGNYTPDTWVCMEVFLDQSNGQATLWVDGVNQGAVDISGVGSASYSIDQIEIGGNQSDIPGSGNHYMDYDDLVVSTTYIGPSGGIGGDGSGMDLAAPQNDMAAPQNDMAAPQNDMASPRVDAWPSPDSFLLDSAVDAGQLDAVFKDASAPSSTAGTSDGCSCGLAGSDSR